MPTPAVPLADFVTDSRGVTWRAFLPPDDALLALLSTLGAGEGRMRAAARDMEGR